MILMIPPDDSVNLKYARRIVRPGEPVEILAHDVESLEKEGWTKATEPKKKKAARKDDGKHGV